MQRTAEHFVKQALDWNPLGEEKGPKAKAIMEEISKPRSRDGSMDPADGTRPEQNPMV